MYRIYKLIKNYPSIPVDWEIGMEVGVGDNQTMYSPCNSKYTDKKLLPYEIVQFPEFWKLVEEKEWEIVDESQWIKGNLYFIGGITNSYKTIKSVKRLSDDTIFSIGDKVINPKLRSNATFTITRFELDCNGEHMLAFGGGGAIGIHKIEKYKEPLFITEDKVEIFKGDGYWQVTPEFNHYFIGNNDYARRDCDKHFSTEQAAKEYIRLNKPKYSLEDIYSCLELVSWGGGLSNYLDLDKLHELKE